MAIYEDEDDLTPVPVMADTGHKPFGERLATIEDFSKWTAHHVHELQVETRDAAKRYVHVDHCKSRHPGLFQWLSIIIAIGTIVGGAVTAVYFVARLNVMAASQPTTVYQPLPIYIPVRPDAGTVIARPPRKRR